MHSRMVSSSSSRPARNRHPSGRRRAPAAMDEWNTSHHGASGLTERVRASTTSDAEEKRARSRSSPSTSTRASPVLAGIPSSRIVASSGATRRCSTSGCTTCMVDVSTVKELGAPRASAVVAKQPGKKETDRALDDVRESIAELRFDREHVFAGRPPNKRRIQRPRDQFSTAEMRGRGAALGHRYLSVNDTIAMIMAGGKGSRLGPLMMHLSKPGVPFAGLVSHHRSSSCRTS